MIVCVLGMHRSGTSAMAGLLHSNGIVMGREKEFRPRPMKENPKGFFENIRFRRINDTILARNGYKVKSFSPSIPFIYPGNSDLEDKMKSILEGYQISFENWGWKDPRTSLTLYAWADVLNQLDMLKDFKIIYMKRNIENISRSMKARGNKERYNGQFVDLALKYYNKCNFYLEYLEYRLYLKTKTISFEDNLLRKTEETCKVLSSFLNYDICDSSFIECKLSRQSGL